MINLSIQPSQLEIQLKPGTSYVQSYIVKNTSEQSVVLNTSVDSWTPQGSEGNVTYLNSPPDMNLSLSNSDLKLGQSFILNPGQNKQLVLKIQATTLGDHYFTFFINQDTSAIDSTNSTQLIRLGSHLLISVSNLELPTTNFKVNDFKITNPFIDCFLSPVEFSGDIKNDSDYFNKIDDRITISKNGNNIKELVLFPDNVLAHNYRQIRCLNDKSPTDCRLINPLWPGVYQVSIADKSTFFVVLPYSLLIFLLLLIIIIKLFRKPKKQ
jgi:hypothetical protein